MKERPILFSAPMVRAILEGRKTQTRRIIKKPMDEVPDYARGWKHNGYAFYGKINGGDMAVPFICPYGQRGDRLWVRETWANTEADGLVFKADGERDFRTPCGTVSERSAWKPSIHMPRTFSRITLEITDVRVERLQDISEADAIAEGCGKSKGGMFCGGPHKAHGTPTQHNTAKEAYSHLWESINGAGSWDANPWVWVISFRKAKP